MRALIIGPDEQAAIAKVMAYAMEPAHFYTIGGPIPGDNPAYTCTVPDGFRCVFTFTRDKRKLFRHLTISVPGELLPSPESCVVIAKEFGFTASDEDLNLILRMERDGWLAGRGHQGENCIVVIQPTTHSETGLHTTIRT